MAAACGLAIEQIDLIEGRPEYMRISAATHLVGLAYERAVNASALLAPLRIVLIASLNKPK